MVSDNPLRYPGAKSKLIPYIQNLIQTEGLLGCTFYEAYAGSAAVSFGLLKKGIICKAKINELDPLIYNFWLSVMEHTDELIQMINDTDVTVENWNEISKFRNANYLTDKRTVDIGFAGLFLNRTNFSGILKAGHLGGKDNKSPNKINCRFNKEKIIKNIQELSTYSERIELFNMDAIKFLHQETHYKRNRSIFVYIDPPYYQKGASLYRYYYKHDMHTALSKYIKSKIYPWLISYDNSPAIKKMYCKKPQQPIYLDYSANTKRKEKELLISNLKIPPVTNAKAIEKSLII